MAPLNIESGSFVHLNMFALGVEKGMGYKVENDCSLKIGSFQCSFQSYSWDIDFHAIASCICTSVSNFEILFKFTTNVVIM